MEAWKKFLDTTKVEALLEPDFQLISAMKNDSLLDVLKVFREKNISSVPVYDPETATYLGILDIFDLLTVFVFMTDLKDLVDTLAKKDVDWYKYVENEMVVLRDTTAQLAINSSQRNPWCPVSRLKPLHSLMDMLSKDVNLHRVPIVDDNGNVIGFVTQSKVIDFLYKNIERYTDTTTLRIKDYFTPSEVVSISAQSKAIDGYKLMINKRVSGIAVVDAEGKLVGALSASDLKRSLEGNLVHDLFLPIYLYLEKTTPEFEKNLLLQPISCSVGMTIYEALHKLVTRRIHRLFVLDAEKPIGVLSLCDIISLMNVDRIGVNGKQAE